MEGQQCALHQLVGGAERDLALSKHWLAARSYYFRSKVAHCHTIHTRVQDGKAVGGSP